MILEKLKVKIEIINHWLAIRNHKELGLKGWHLALEMFSQGQFDSIDIDSIDITYQLDMLIISHSKF